MTVALIVLAILAIVLFGLGFVESVLWWVAIALLVLFLLALVFRGSAGRRTRI
jgi:hypothetical protein